MFNKPRGDTVFCTVGMDGGSSPNAVSRAWRRHVFEELPYANSCLDSATCASVQYVRELTSGGARVVADSRYGIRWSTL